MPTALRHYAAQCSPATQLPVELWDIIFDMSRESLTLPSLAHSPLNVSQVCRRWRTTALLHSALWSTLAVVVTQRHESSVDALLVLVHVWLQRAGRRLLDISLAQLNSVHTANSLGSLLQVVLGHSDRLHSLEINSPEASLLSLEMRQLSFPVLEHLKINTPWPTLATPDLVVALNDARCLKTFTARHTFFDVGKIGGLAYNELTELTLLPHSNAPGAIFWSSDDALDLLSSAAHLIKLRLAFNDTLPRRRSMAHAPALRSLSLKFRDSETPQRSIRVGAFFNLLDTPNLLHLSLRDHGAMMWPISTWPQTPFLSYLGATQLRSLHLANLPLFETQVIECLQRVPNVVELVLEAPPNRGSQRNVGDLLLRALTNQPQPIASALRTVEFRHCGKRCTEEALISMVDSRALEYLRVHRSALPSPELVQRVANWNTVVDVVY
ncbi:hypothetical protein MIND_00099600 [Mycena indigotica]|uniref:F-box domain-containing protein n=1 Tax=Mycena indigotica TaxID=2126181 RepID=A0A8H6WKK4_9AGAR|nr:uncharacterized protein MIND_00099600 [Mycena indigotica]KAF7315834.1 hypothetical protein MIND_00099600 [Mycena indigotica]